MRTNAKTLYCVNLKLSEKVRFFVQQLFVFGLQLRFEHFHLGQNEYLVFCW